MRVYAVGTLPLLRELLDSGRVDCQQALGATEGLRVAAQIESGDDELLEFVAMGLALDAALLAQTVPEPAALDDVVVIAADVLSANEILAEPGLVTLPHGISRDELASVHIATKAEVRTRLATGEELDATDLAWWAAQELGDLVAELSKEGHDRG